MNWKKKKKKTFRLSLRQRSQSPANLQRTGSGRFASPFTYGHGVAAVTPAGVAGVAGVAGGPTGSITSPQSNLDSLESYDSGLGLGTSPFLFLFDLIFLI